MYENCKIFRPYLRRKDNRYIIIAVDTENKKHTISYPKYLMECKLNRKLYNYETVHHIDGNPLNNSFDNLKILFRSEHAKLHAKRNDDIIVKCYYCGKEFKIKGNTLHNRNRKDKINKKYFCSRRCSGLYGTSIQYKNKKPKFKIQIIKR